MPGCAAGTPSVNRRHKIEVRRFLAKPRWHTAHQLRWSGAMKHFPVTQEQRDSVRAVTLEIEKITTHTRAIFQRLQHLVCNQEVSRTLGVSISHAVETGDMTEMGLKTPFGAVKIQLLPFVSDEGVLGRCVVSRKDVSASDTEIWVDIWFFCVTPHGTFFQGADPSAEAGVMPTSLWGDDEDVFDLLLSIIFVAGKEH